MKQMKKWITLLLAVLVLFCGSITAFAQDDAASSIPSAVSSESEESGNNEDSVLVLTSEEAGASQLEESSAELPETTPEKADSSNTPYFIGAGIAVLAFLGVFVFCKIKGKN